MTEQIWEKEQGLVEGQMFNVTESIDPSDILIYLGVTRDLNPVYALSPEGDWSASVVPPVLLMGYITQTVSNHFPGPGSVVTDLSLSIFRKIHPLDTLTFVFQLDHLDARGNGRLSVTGSTVSGVNVLNATVDVDIPKSLLGGDQDGQ